MITVKPNFFNCKFFYFLFLLTNYFIQKKLPTFAQPDNFKDSNKKTTNIQAGPLIKTQDGGAKKICCLEQISTFFKNNFKKNTFLFHFCLLCRNREVYPLGNFYWEGMYPLYPHHRPKYTPPPLCTKFAFTNETTGQVQ